jgi:hypothetical protein
MAGGHAQDDQGAPSRTDPDGRAIIIDKHEQSTGGLVGLPSDESPEILACGGSDVTTLFISMAEKHPAGADADYLRWHTLDHRPEQQRLPAIRASLRAVSTPACRRARAACDASLTAVDHVMTYFFTGLAGLEAFSDLSIALRNAGRSPFILPPVQRGVYTVASRTAAPRARVGADVLPWLPVRGVYMLLEQGRQAPAPLTEVPGIAGVWCADSVPTQYSSTGESHRLSLCFLDGDPVDTAARLRPVLEARWNDGGMHPLLAAPFYSIVPFEWNRYLP